MSEDTMDPFTKKLLEKTRQRRAQLHEKLQSTPSASPRKRKPLQIDTSQNSTDFKPVTSDSEHPEDKRRRSSTNQAPLEPSASSKDSLNESHGSPAMKSKGSLAQLSVQNENEDSGLDSEYERRRMSCVTSSEEPSPTPVTRTGRLAKLAQQINGWEDDLSHPTIVPSPRKEEPKKKVWQPSKPEEPVITKPPKPVRTFQTEAAQPQATRSSPRFAATQPTSSTGQLNENNAFKFGTPSQEEKKTGSGATRQPPPPPVQKADANDPAQKSVSDRFAIWAQKTSDVGGPMRSATPLKTATPMSTRSRSGNNIAPTPSKPYATPVNQKTAAVFRPSPANRSRRRSRSATPISRTVQTPERERTGAAAPWQAKTASPQPQQQPEQGDEQWAQKRRTKETTFDTAPMSARKNAWEAKIAEQHSVAEEHNRIMYRTRSATRLGSDGTQKQSAVEQLKKGQNKVYDPAEKARLERQAELKALQNRFNDKGLLQCDAPATSNGSSVTGSIESLEEQEYYTATETDNEKEVQGNVAAEIDTRKVSFKANTAQRRKSDSPVEENRNVRDKKLSRRSSCKIPSLGYSSSSDEAEVEPSPVPKLFGKPGSRSRSDSGSPNKIPRLGDESSADSQEDDISRQTSASSLASSQSGASYHVASNEIDDLLDEAMSGEEAEPTPPPRKVLSPRRRTPEQRKASPAGPAMYSIDAYRKKNKSVAQVSAPVPAPRHPVSLSSYDDTISVCSNEQMSDQELRKRIKELQESVQQEQNVIVQTSNALNQCCQGGMSFAGSTEQVECNRLLLIACQRRQAFLSEIERLKSSASSRVTRKGKGSLTISDIQLPLKRDFVKKIGTADDTTVHYFLLMLRNRAQVIVTQMVSTHDAMMRGTLHLPNLIKLNDIMNDFKFELEVYSMQVSREPIRTPSKKDKKKIISRSKSTVQALVRMTSVTSSLSSSSARNSAAGSGTMGGNQVRTTNFTHITSLVIDMNSVQQSTFNLSRVPYLSPLQGTIQMRLRCTMEANIVHRGFVNMFEDVGGFGAWHRRWCVLNDNRVCYWKYPDDEKDKEPMGQICLKDCATSEIGLVSRDKCARPNTVEIVIIRPASKADTSSMNRQLRDRMTQEQHWFGMDTKPDRMEWCSKLNEALANVRQWYSDAVQPVPAKRNNI